MRSNLHPSNPEDPNGAGRRAPRHKEAPGSVAPLLRRWLAAAPPVILERAPRPEDEQPLFAQLAAVARADPGGDWIQADP
jgi:hypothetical protein